MASMRRIVIIGAGPAGLSCALTLQKGKAKPRIVILDRNARPGGLARSFSFQGHWFDVGPHRFYTKNPTIDAVWKKTLGAAFHPVNRLTRILYGGKLFSYPLDAWDVMKKLGPKDVMLSMFSYATAKLRLFRPPAETFTQWVTARFGYRLYAIFFKTYTEKVWGVSCDNISAKWAVQRIQNLSIVSLVLSAFNIRPPADPKSLVRSFYYPVQGSGQMYTRMAELLRKRNVALRYQSHVMKIHHRAGIITRVDYVKRGKRITETPSHVFSSMPITAFISALSPTPPKAVVAAAASLRYRDHITVNLVVHGTSPFPDQWLYIHSPDFQMARVTNYNNFRPHTSSRKTHALSVEYFVFKEDKLWNAQDSTLVHLAHTELISAGLLSDQKLTGSFVVREADAYPAYYLGYEKAFDIIKEYAGTFTNVTLIGRGGMYKYNNMDHAMESGIHAAENYQHRDTHDLWSINEDGTYLEEK